MANDHYTSVANQLLAMRQALETEVLNAVRIHIDDAIAKTCNIIESNHTLTYVEATEFDKDDIVGNKAPLAIHAVTLEAKGLAFHYWSLVSEE